MTQAGWAEQVAIRVRQAAETAGLSPNRLATLSGIPAPTLRRRVDKVPGLFTVDEISRIAEATGQPFGWLIAGVTDSDIA